MPTTTPSGTTWRRSKRTSRRVWGVLREEPASAAGGGADRRLQSARAGRVSDHRPGVYRADRAGPDAMGIAEVPGPALRPHHAGEGARTVPREFENIAIYYTTVDGALTVTLSEKVLQHAIDRSLGRQRQRQAAGDGPNGRQTGRIAGGSRPTGRRPAVARQQRRPAGGPQDSGGRQRRPPRPVRPPMQEQCWNNLPILNEWKRLYPDRDPVAVHRAGLGRRAGLSGRRASTSGTRSTRRWNRPCTGIRASRSRARPPRRC